MSVERKLLAKVLTSEFNSNEKQELYADIKKLLAQTEIEKEDYFTDTDRKILKQAMIALCKVAIALKSKNTWNENLYATVEDVVGVISKWAMDKSPSKL